MKYTKQQLDLIVTNIYNQISKPIEEENRKILDAAPMPTNIPILKDILEYQKHEETVRKLTILKDKLIKKYLGKADLFYNSASFKRYVDDLKKTTMVLKQPPTKTEIEYEILINSDEDIKKIIEALLIKYKI
jgi:hypothetical protein